MTDAASAPLQSRSAIPADDPNRKLTVADPDRFHGAPRRSGRRHLQYPRFRRADSRTVLLDRHDRARWQRPASTPPRFRGDVHAAGGRARVHLPRRNQNRACGIDSQRPRQRAAHVIKNFQDARAPALCLCAPAGQEEFFMEVGDPLDSHNLTAAKARQGRNGRADEEG